MFLCSYYIKVAIIKLMHSLKGDKRSTFVMNFEIFYAHTGNLKKPQQTSMQFPISRP